MVQAFPSILFPSIYSKTELQILFSKIMKTNINDILVYCEITEWDFEKKYQVTIEQNFFENNDIIKMSLDIRIYNDSLFFSQDIEFYSLIMQYFESAIYIDTYTYNTGLIKLDFRYFDDEL